MESFSEKPKNRVNGRTNKSISITGTIEGKNILNIGCLGGWYEEYLVEKGGYNSIIGLDLPGKHIEELNEKYKDYNNIEFIEANVMELPFEKNSFDIVSMWEVIEHIPKGTELFVLMEINRVLRKGGKLLLSTPNTSFLSNSLDPAWYFGHRHYSKNEIEYLVKESGFFQFKTETCGGIYEMLSMILFYLCKHILRKEIPFKDFFDKKRIEEFKKPGFTNIFLEAIKNRDS